MIYSGIILQYIITEELPFCWYFTVQGLERQGKKIDFIGKEEGFSEQFEIENFVDPLVAMVGFVMRNPRVGI